MTITVIDNIIIVRDASQISATTSNSRMAPDVGLLPRA